MSNRAIADVVGVHHSTVIADRQSGGGFPPPVPDRPVTGKDGKQYLDSRRPLAVPTLTGCCLCPMIHRTVAVVVDGLTAMRPWLGVQASRDPVDGVVYGTHRALYPLDGFRRDFAPHGSHRVRRSPDSARNEHPRKQSHAAKGTRFNSCGRRFGKETSIRAR
jgi:hypothetical protein